MTWTRWRGGPPTARGDDEWDCGVLAITHFRRLLHELTPTQIHVLSDGRVVATGGPELAEILERDGYEPFGPPRVTSTSLTPTVKLVGWLKEVTALPGPLREASRRKRSLANESRLVALGEAVDHQRGTRTEAPSPPRRGRTWLIVGARSSCSSWSSLGGGYLYAN